MKRLHLDFEKSKNERVADKLLWYLGNYSPLLEKLVVSPAYDNMKFLSIECIKVFTMGCPLVRKIIFKNTNVSSVFITNLINSAIQLEELTLRNCNICHDGLIITKDRDKLQHLKSLYLSSSGNITDESFINIIQGCNNIECISIYCCKQLTDASLFSIAASCPNLKEISYKYNKFTNIGLNELKNKCLQLNVHSIY